MGNIFKLFLLKIDCLIFLGDKRKNSGSRKVTAEEKVKPSAPVAVATTVAADGIRGSAASVQLESSLVELEDRQAAKSGRAEHGSEGLQEKGRAGIGSVVSMFPLRSHVVVSSRVDVRIGGVSKVKPKNGSSTPQSIFERRTLPTSCENILEEIDGV